VHHYNKIKFSQCLFCKHFIGKKTNSTYLYCDSFKDGIPEKIIHNDFDHTKKHPDQKNDIVFEPIEAGEHTGLKP